MFILILTYKVQFNWDLNSVNLFYLQVSKALEVVNRYCETIFLGLLDDALFQCSCLKVIEGYVCWSFRLTLASRKFADKRLLMPVWLNEAKLLAGSGTRFHWNFLVNFSCFFFARFYRFPRLNRSHSDMVWKSFFPVQVRWQRPRPNVELLMGSTIMKRSTSGSVEFVWMSFQGCH